MSVFDDVLSLVPGTSFVFDTAEPVYSVTEVLDKSESHIKVSVRSSNEPGEQIHWIFDMSEAHMGKLSCLYLFKVYVYSPEIVCLEPEKLDCLKGLSGETLKGCLAKTGRDSWFTFRGHEYFLEEVNEYEGEDKKIAEKEVIFESDEQGWLSFCFPKGQSEEMRLELHTFLPEKWKDVGFFKRAFRIIQR